MTTNPIDRLMSLLYTESKLNLREIASIFKISSERVQQRLRRCKTPMRPQGKNNRNDKFPMHPKWQIEYMNRLIRFGMPMTQAMDLLSISRWCNIKADNGGCIDYRGLGTLYNNPQVTMIHHELNKLILISAWKKGATLKDLAGIFDSTSGTVAMVIYRMREQGYNLPVRWKGPR